MKIRNQIARVAGALLLTAGLGSIKGQILVGPTGSPNQDFVTQPPVTSWSTFTGAGAQTLYSAPGPLDTDVIANTAASSVATVTGSSGTVPPSVANIARRNTSGQYMQIRPNNGTAYVLLMATLQNDTGGNVAFLNVSYDFNEVLQAATAVRAEEIPGWRAYYSLTGDFASWVPIPEFATAAPGRLSASLSVGTWAQGAPLYILWADDDAVANNTLPNVEAAYTIDNFVAVPSAGREPSVTGFRSGAYGFVMDISDGTPPLSIKESSVTATLNGSAITPTYVKNGDAITISYSQVDPLASGSTNTVVLNYTDSNTPAKPYTVTRTYVVTPYVVIPASNAVTGVDTNSSGMSAFVHQIGGPRRPDVLPGAGLFDQNSIASAETQLANGFNDPNTSLPYDNLAVQSAEPDGRYTVTNVNWNQTIPPPAAEVGSISDLSAPSRPDEAIPGIVNTPDNIVSELLTFVELKAGRIYRMAVNSDDGFKVTYGQNPRDPNAPVLFQFNGGRGVADTTMDFRVEADGIYPMRLLWWEGGGGAALEWFTIDEFGNKYLLNDREVAAAVKTYSIGPATPAYVKSLLPYPGQTNLTGGLVISGVIADGTTTVATSGVKLFVNNVDVTGSATIAKTGAETKFSYDPPGTLAPSASLAVRIEFTDSASTTRTNTYTIAVFPQILVDVDDTRLWKYNDKGDDLGTTWRDRTFDDSTWTDPVNGGEGPALLGFETTSVEPMRTLIRRTREDGTQPTTFYFRTHFNFSGNPATVNLFLRHVVDDGAVFYLNGQELDRFGLADGAAYTSATFFTGHENVWEGPFSVPRASLINGDNVVAVEVHQSDGTSSDVVMGVQLYFVPDPNATPAKLASFSPATNAVNQATNQTLIFLLEEGTTSINESTIKLTVNGAVVTPVIDKPAGGILTTVSYTPPGNGYTPESIVTGNLEFRDSANALTTQAFNFQIAPTLEPIFLVDETGTTLPTQNWKYLNTGEDAGTAWKEKIFDDSQWLEGAPLFGAAETGATVAPQRTPTLSRVGIDGVTRITTDYFRTHFTLTNDPATVRLAIRHAVDDGPVVFINGQEVHRFGFDPGLTTITYTNTTITDHENRWEGPFILNATNLVAGDNVIAVEVHQNAASSSDMIFGLELYRITSTAPQSNETRFEATTLTGGQVRIAWTGPGRLQENTNVANVNGWTDVANASNPYLTPPSGTMKYFRVIQ